MATNVFISYRRDDTRDFTGRLADRLRGVAGIDNVFIDVDGIEPGADFAAKIDAALKQCAFCLLIIGPNWLGKADGGAARIKDDRDWVRMEARNALASDAIVVPVLAGGAAMPGEEDLPEDLRKLARINAIQVRHEAFDRDADYLIDIILKRKKPGTIQSYLNRHPLQAAMLKGAGGFLLALFLLIVGAVMLNTATRTDDDPGLALNQVLGGTGPMLVFVFAWLAAGIAAPFILRRRPRRRAA